MKNAINSIDFQYSNSTSTPYLTGVTINNGSEFGTLQVSPSVYIEPSQFYISDSNDSNFYVSQESFATFKPCIQIKNVEILGELENVVQVTFEDGTKEKAICDPDDTFNLEIGISICIAKYLIGGSGEYHKAIRQGIKLYKQKEEKRIKEKFQIAELEERRKRKYLKNQKRKAKKAEKERLARIQEQAEAMVLAQKMLAETKNHNPQDIEEER